MRHVYGWWLAVGLAGLVAGPAAAELFRCQGPDGRTIYTDQKDTCPGAKPFEPSGVVPSAPTPARPEELAPDGPAEATPAATGHSPHADQADAEAAMAQQWQDRKRAVLDQIAQIQARREGMRKYVNHCKWRDYVATRDEAGVEQVVNCSEFRREFAALDEREGGRARIPERRPPRGVPRGGLSTGLDPLSGVDVG